MDNTLYTPGEWKEGKQLGTIVSDADASDAYSKETEEYYGGLLIAESIANPNDVKLMAEAKNLLQIAEMMYDSLDNDKSRNSLAMMMVKPVLQRLGSR